MSTLSQPEIADKAVKEMSIIMLSLYERDPTFSKEEAWDLIATELIGDNDRKAALHFLKGETFQLVCLGTDSVRVGSNGAKTSSSYSATPINKKMQSIYVCPSQIT